jgi:hypothetical protein
MAVVMDDNKAVVRRWGQREKDVDATINQGNGGSGW